MKLLHVTATHLNLAGGIPVVLRELVKSQNEIDMFEARVLSVNADISSMNSVYFDYLGTQSFAEYVEKFNPDLVIFHSHYYLEYLRFFRYLLRRKTPYLIEPHGSFGTAALKKSKYRKAVANATVFRKLIKCASGFVFLNEAEKEDAVFRSKNEFVIPNGIDCKRINNIVTSNTAWNFYFIGRYDINHKGLDYLFDALDIVEMSKTNITVKLFGAGNDSCIEYINSRISSLQSVNVTNCGPVYGGEKDELLEQCGVMLLTSRYEGFPMTVLESWGYGNPCVVTPGTNVYHETINNHLGWGTTLDAQCIAKTILQAKKEYETMKEQFIARTKDYVARKYDWSKVAYQSYVLLSEFCNLQ